MAKSIRLAVIGAGSAVFSLSVVRDLCLTDSLDGSTIIMMDIDEGRLDLVLELARRYARELGKDLRFEKTLDRAIALKDADFVINSALAGGHRREEEERSLAERCGYYRGMMPAEGFFHQYNFTLSVARDIERICPDAWLIQSSNPVFDVCTLMTRETSTKVIGLCHGPFGGIREMATVLGMDPTKITFEAPGLNHCVWLSNFEYQGENAYPILDNWIAKESERYWKQWKPRYHDNQMSPGAIHMYKFFGKLPLGDASRAIWPDAWWYHNDLETKQRWWGDQGGFDSELGWQEYLDDLTKGLSEIHDAATDPNARVSDIFPPVMSGEQIVPIIDAIANNKRRQFIVNVPNKGALSGVPDDVVVEVPALVDSRGVHRIQVARLPDSVMYGAVLPQWLAMERRLAGFRTGDSRFLLQYLLTEHRTHSWEHAEATLDAVMRMPGNEPMAQYYAHPLDGVSK